MRGWGVQAVTESPLRLSFAFRDNNMVSFELTQEASAYDVLAFSDAELVQYMTQNRRPDGGFDLDPAGWDALPRDQRERLAERLKQVLDARSPVVPCPPLLIAEQVRGAESCRYRAVP